MILPFFNKVIACAKHLIAGSDPINGLNLSPMDISQRTLNEIFLPPYKKAVDAGVFSIMAAHQQINGIILIQIKSLCLI